MLLAIALTFHHPAKKGNPLAPQQPSHDALARQVKTKDLEGTITPADIRRAQKPLSERRRLLAKHPYFFLYTIAKERFDVSLYLLAAVHYQETGFHRAPAKFGTYRRWKRNRNAIDSVVRPARYPHHSGRHPSVRDDFDVVMAIAQGLKRNGARGLGGATTRAIGLRYGSDPDGRLAAAMVLERARAWRLLGTIPLPGRGELATPVKGVVGGCGYFGCPRPGHLHNGVDFLAPSGTPIHAADDGIVASVESPGESGGYGNFVCIQHRPHLASCYAHMSAFAANVHPGARVHRGQVIGLVGSTGSSTAPHLHFEVRRGPAACQACAVDPLPMLSGEVPEDTLPKMAAATQIIARASSFAAVGVTAAPAARAPGAAAPAPGAATAPVDSAPVPDPPIDATPIARNRSVPVSQSGGARPTPPVAPPPAPAPAPAPAQPAPAASTAAPAEVDTGTGGATPDLSSPEASSAAASAAPPHAGG
jgi:murein DD-endopeptidase MepM/ murein hydrolase activator NlpD